MSIVSDDERPKVIDGGLETGKEIPHRRFEVIDLREWAINPNDRVFQLIIRGFAQLTKNRNRMPTWLILLPRDHKRVIIFFRTQHLIS